MNDHDELAKRFVEIFDNKPDLLARAPGRVNLVGEHTDYNEGFVLPMAIDREVLIAARSRKDRLVQIYSVDLYQFDKFDLDTIDHAQGALTWTNYIRGVAHTLQCAGFTLNGLDLVISGSIPHGAGLSSSAALELATITAFRLLSGLEIDPLQAAVICQKAENEFVGVRCGIMDQMVSSLGRAGAALFIDCRDLEYEAIPIPSSISIVVIDTGLRRGLVDSAYNERRRQCEEGAELMGVRSLRAIDLATLANHQEKLPPLIARRCTHVVAENKRVLDAAMALKKGETEEFGILMNDSHFSLRDLFEVSTPEIDILVSIQQNAPGCLGARLTGAGFGGCTVAAVNSDAVSDFQRSILENYRMRGDRKPQIYVCKPAEGAGII